MDALDALRDKRDTRRYRTDPIDHLTLAQLLGAARMAGSAKNVQPVRLVVVEDADTKTSLKAAGNFADWIDQAPVVVVATVRGEAGPRRLFDVGRHTQNLMVAGHAVGLASCPVTIHHPDVARDLLNIPADVEPVMFITLGWPAPTEPRAAHQGHPRLPLGEYAMFGRWSRTTLRRDPRPGQA